VRPKIGCILPADTCFSSLVEISQICERLGYDSIWAFDHLAPSWSSSAKAFECWTILASLAAHTVDIKLGSLVTNVNLRHPSLLAKITSSLDNISHGRLILGLGAGDRLSKRELTSFGYRYETLDERMMRLRETVQILRGLWVSNDFSFAGKCFRLTHARLEPKPAQPNLPIWIGGKHDKLMDLVAELADGWNYWNISREQLVTKTSYLRGRCAHVRRSYDRIVKAWSGTVPRDCPTDELVDHLMEESDAKSTYFIGYFGGHSNRESLEKFADATRRV